MEAIVLAGGLGTRLRSVVSGVPKPMAPVRGRPFLELLLDRCIDQGIDRFVIAVGYLGQQVTAHFGVRYRNALIDYSYEDTPLGTGGALLLALKQVKGPDVLVLNGDTYFPVDVGELERYHRAHGADCTLSLFRSHDTARYMSVQLDHTSAVVALGPAVRSDVALVNGGLYVFRTAVFETGPWKTGESLSLETQVLPDGLSRGWRICGFESATVPLDIGLPQDYQLAQTELPGAA